MELLECLPVTQYGQGQAKTVEHLLKEIESGEAQIVWEENRPIRVVNILVADVFSLDGKQYLVEEKQVFADGRVRERTEEDGSPKQGISEKMQPGEVSQDAVYRAVEEELGLEDDGWGAIRTACLGQEVEEEESPSYPGLLTRYIKHKWQVFLSPELVKPEGYTEIQSDKSTYFAWRTV